MKIKSPDENYAPLKQNDVRKEAMNLKRWKKAINYFEIKV